MQNRLFKGGDLPRSAHGAWVTRRAGAQLGDKKLQRAANALLGFLQTQITRSKTELWIGVIIANP